MTVATEQRRVKICTQCGAARHYCRHRRPRWLLINTSAAAVLVLAVGVGAKLGATADALSGSWEAAACTVELEASR